MTLRLGRYGGRHPLGVEIDQGERRTAIDDIGGDAGDQVRPRRAVEQHLLGRDRNLIGQIGAQAAECECSYVCERFRSRRESIDAVYRDALGGARNITQADLSCINVPSAASEICLVNGPPTLVNLVSMISGGGAGVPLIACTLS